MTAAERLRQLAGVGGTAAVLLLAIGAGATAGAALVDYSGLPAGTAAQHLLAEQQQDESPSGGGWSITPPISFTSHLALPAVPLPEPGAPGEGIQPIQQLVAEGARTPARTPAPTKVGDGETAPPSPSILTAASEPPPIVVTHFDLDQLTADSKSAAILQRRRNDEALLLILAIAEST